MAVHFDAAVILCYVQGASVREVADFDFGSDPVGLMREYFARQIETAEAAGLRKVIIDPGSLGFITAIWETARCESGTKCARFWKPFACVNWAVIPSVMLCPHAFEYFGEEVRSAEAFFAVLAALGQTNLFRTHEVARIKAVLDTLRVF